MSTFSETSFRSRVNDALDAVKRIVDSNRTPHYAEEVPHDYSDKFSLAEFLTCSALATSLSTLQAIGMSPKQFDTLKEWSKSRAVTLRLKAEETCKFVKEKTRKEESATRHVVEYSGDIKEKAETKIVTKITEYFWKFSFSFEVYAFAGTDFNKKEVFRTRSGSLDLITTSKVFPRPENVVRDSLDVNITWLLQKFDSQSTVAFKIDRSAKRCHTPRRNPDIDEGLRLSAELGAWGTKVAKYFMEDLFPVDEKHGLDLSSLEDNKSVFIPVIPLFEEGTHAASSTTSGSLVAKYGASKVIPPSYFSDFQVEQRLTLSSKRMALDKIFPTNNSVITLSEAEMVFFGRYLDRLHRMYSDGVDYIEHMLRQQLIAAIGKAVSPADFNDYLTFHNRKLFRPEFQPKPLSYSIRRPGYSPEGTISIEGNVGSGPIEPIHTFVSHTKARTAMKFNLDASSQVKLYGDRYLHGWLTHDFEEGKGNAMKLSLNARARQFSSFILLAGKLIGSDLFEPSCALIIRNKDDLKIPLILETIPTPKEFKKAISSMSPEQQRFSKAFRAMQLSSSIFGVCVIQIKPQLEKLLNLPRDALTREIALTEKLQDMFITYQLTSDLLSYDPAVDIPAPVLDEVLPATLEQKLDFVKAHVNDALVLILTRKRKELKSAAEKAIAADPISFITNATPASIDLSDSASGSADYSEEEEAWDDDEYEAPRLMSAGLDDLMTNARSMQEYSAMPMAMPSPPKAASPKKLAAPPKPSPASRDAAAPPPPPAPKPIADTPQSVPPPSTPSTPSTTPEQPLQPQEKAPVAGGGREEESGVLDLVDYTKIPAALDEMFSKFDEDGALHSTIIKLSDDNWTREVTPSLLAKPLKQSLGVTERTTEKNKAFDLLDALTKSGLIPIEDAEFHVIVASTHCFEKSVIETVIQDNLNPIDKLERSALMMASVVHAHAADDLVMSSRLLEVSGVSPKLFIGQASAL